MISNKRFFLFSAKITAVLTFWRTSGEMIFDRYDYGIESLVQFGLNTHLYALLMFSALYILTIPLTTLLLYVIFRKEFSVNITKTKEQEQSLMSLAIIASPILMLAAEYAQQVYQLYQ